MKVPYLWIWPGQPGGYQPVVAEEMARSSKAKEQFNEARSKGKAAQAPARSQVVSKARRRATRDNTNLFKGKKKPTK